MRTVKLAGRSAAAAVVLMSAACATTPMATEAAGPTLADREAIEATLYNYARGLDRHDPDLYASAWAEDAVFDLGGGRVFEGREAMRGIVQGLVDSYAEAAERGDPPRQIFHMDANPRLEFVAPDHAFYHAYYFTIARTGEGQEATNTIIDTGSTVDELRKIDGQWLIVKRTVTEAP
jgi:ketosteroid isomerase-like protein